MLGCESTDDAFATNNLRSPSLSALSSWWIFSALDGLLDSGFSQWWRVFLRDKSTRGKEDSSGRLHCINTHAGIPEGRVGFNTSGCNPEAPAPCRYPPEKTGRRPRRFPDTSSIVHANPRLVGSDPGAAYRHIGIRGRAHYCGGANPLTNAVGCAAFLAKPVAYLTLKTLATPCVLSNPRPSGRNGAMSTPRCVADVQRHHQCKVGRSGENR